LPKAVIGILAVALALLSGTLVFVLFPPLHPEAPQLISGHNSSAAKQDGVSAAAAPKEDDRNPTLRIGTAWQPKMDKVEKQFAIFIPLEDQAGFAGAILIGCIYEGQPHFFLNLAVTDKYRAIIASSEPQTIKVSVPNEDYNFPLRGRYKDGVLFFSGYAGDFSVESELRQKIDRARYMKGLFESFHRSKNLDFNMANSTLSIRQSGNLVEAHNRMFEGVAAFCIDNIE
jgi:hypothetical protein